MRSGRMSGAQLPLWLVPLAVLSTGCEEGSFSSNIPTEDTAALCSDKQDNDGDNKVDCADPDCDAFAPCDGSSKDSGGTWPDMSAPVDYGQLPDSGPCVATEAEAKNKLLPVDIIWFVDTSGSMDFETKTVQNNLNAFAQSISKSGLDYRVVMVAGSGDICVPAPLGGAGCKDGPRYKHIKLSVGSRDGLQKLIQAYPQYQSFLRPDSLKHFVAVTDDNSKKSDSWFTSQIASLKSPGFPKGFYFHSIVAYGPIFWIGCITGAQVGTVYLALTAATKGTKAEVCATNWNPIFAALAKGVTANTKLPCTYAIPSPGKGKTVDPNKVNVSYTPPKGKPQKIPKIKNAAACTGAPGWYYDNETKPTAVTLCPSLCKSLGKGKVKVLFGCKTIIK